MDKETTITVSQSRQQKEKEEFNEEKVSKKGISKKVNDRVIVYKQAESE